MLLLLLLLLLEQRRLRKPERGSRICRFLGFLSSCRCSVGCGGRENKKSTGNTHNKTKHRERERERERETTFHFCYRIVRVSDRDTRGPAFPNGIVARCSIFFHHQTGCLGFRFCVGSLLFCRVRFQTRARLRCRVAFPSTLCCVVVWIYYDLQKRKSGGETIVIFSGHVRIKPESCCDSMSKRQHRVVLFAFRVAAELMDVVNDARHTQNRNNNDAQKKKPKQIRGQWKGNKRRNKTKQNKRWHVVLHRRPDLRADADGIRFREKKKNANDSSAKRSTDCIGFPCKQKKTELRQHFPHLFPCRASAASGCHLTRGSFSTKWREN